ncbi:hypothetical protein M1M11_31490 [Pseudomonas azerbaijanoccidens]|uniref:hypothetical protein n=1 Tax=Pseudomonas azerbaijanoccidentalis TaxID=2842347 RepID=UPI00200AF1AE|nr:hypothetical protein [Pseudomonas azerbaijanoccidentalis]MCK8669410.1 hypothetical protein [Pseudomonas azerbaijanoccidentalis]
MSREAQIRAIEKELGYTEEDAENCSCYANPNGPCANCWSLGWRIGGIEPDTADAKPGAERDSSAFMEGDWGIDPRGRLVEL